MISSYIDKIAPYNTKCEWDNCGMLIGNPKAQVKKIGFALDLTPQTLCEAEKEGVDLMITHHPAIFKAKKSFLFGDLVFDAAQKNISVISAHTCFDCADGGVNDVLASLLGLSDIESIESDECIVPMLRMGKCEKISPKDFARLTAKTLATTVRFINGERSIEKVAVCGGAGMSFLDDVIKSGADAYVTGDISHHEMLEAKEKGITVVAAGHFETEYPAMTALMNTVKKEFETVSCVLLKQDNPVEFIN